MMKGNWLKGFALASMLAGSTINVNAQTTQPLKVPDSSTRSIENLITCAQNLGKWAEQAVENTHISFQEEITVDGMSAVASYDPKTDRMRFLTPYTNTRAKCASLAHEIAHHMLDETGPRKGLASSTQYQGPSPDSIRTYAQWWYNQPRQEAVRKDLAEHLATVEITGLQLAHEFTSDIQKLVSSVDLPVYTRTQATTYLLKARAKNSYHSHLFKSTEEVLQLRLRHAYIDSALAVSEQEASKALNLAETAIDSTAYKHLHDQAIELKRQRNTILSTTRTIIERDSTYFTNPDEIFSRMIQSVVQKTHQHNRFVYDLDTIDARALIFLFDMEFAGESMFRKHLIEYTNSHLQATTSSSSE